ncbi:ABATE domain-containing protein [Amycolatopsis sp. cmx-11-12]|uniref:ABATE domain-containing protein n=1 Tax=Amycolatopsis sp. cmx-11-12 TaxID=2785795 RepID=UPI0039184AC2
MVKEDALAFRFDCGSVWLNLLATKGRTFSANPVERLASPRLLAEWLKCCELSPVRSPDQNDLLKAWELREMLRTLALAPSTGSRHRRTLPGAWSRSYLSMTIRSACLRTTDCDANVPQLPVTPLPVSPARPWTT